MDKKPNLFSSKAKKELDERVAEVQSVRNIEVKDVKHLRKLLEKQKKEREPSDQLKR